MIKNKNYILVSLVIGFFILNLIYGINTVKADANKKIIITFATTPTTASVSKAQLKYNKNFALSYSFDDGLIAGYDPVFKYMNGGYSDYLGQYFGGLYFTDGAGNNVPFRGGYAFISRNANTYGDIHINTPSYIKWTQLQDVVDSAWDVFNHGYTSVSISPSDPNHVYYVGDPGGHAQGPIDYAYELSQNNVEVASHINLKNNSGVVTIPLAMSHVILPNGDANYIQPAFDGHFNGVYAQRSDYTFDGSTTIAPSFVNVNNPISSNRHVMSRWFDYETRYLTGGEYPGGLFNKVDELASNSTGATKYWGQEFTHQVTTSTFSGDWNGGMTWNSWKSLMDHIENSYGRFGNDKAWVAGSEEVYDYMMVKQNSVLSQSLVGNQLTVEIDTTNVPVSLRHYALSLLVNSDAQISTISYGSDFTAHTDNKTTGLVNLDWGVNIYSANDISRVETLVATAESQRTLASISTARTYVNLLSSSQQSTQKNAYITRLDAIVVPLRTWYVKVRGDYATTAAANAFMSTSVTYAPSIYNWNNFGVVKNSTITPATNDLVNMKDSNGLVSTLSLSNTAPFYWGSIQAASTGSNSAIYPDNVISSDAQIYGATTTPAKVKIYGLDNSKNYNIKLYGYTSATGQSGNGAITQYTIGGVAKELTVKANLTQTVDFTNIFPVSGGIEVTINPKQNAYGYGFLNAMSITENLLPAPTSLSYTSPNVYTINSAITPISPTVTGLEVSYGVVPSLPSGLSLNTSTGIISGTPTVVASTATYTVTATNTGGSTTFGVVITVNDTPPTSLSYTSPKVFTKGTIITPFSPTQSGGVIIAYSVSPSLPTGLSLDTETGIISGTPTVSSSSNTYTITGTNSGGSTTFNLNITVNEIAPTSLSYTTPNIFARSSAITPLTPTVTGLGISYSVSPALPAGLSLDTGTGVISGTPTVTMSSSSYTVTATNSGGNTTFILTITVNDIAPSALSYTSPNTFTKNSAITSLSPTVTGNVTSYSVSPSLPTGLSLDTTTGIISGTPTTVTGIYTYTVTATNSGGSTTFGVVVTVEDIIPGQQTLSSISITNPATKLVYNLREDLDITGLIVTGTYSDNSTQVENINIGDISGFDNIVSGTKILTVTFGGKTTTYQVYVIGINTVIIPPVYHSSGRYLPSYESVKKIEVAKNVLTTINKTPILFVFTKNLQIGSRNKEVLDLQKYLNNHGFIIIKNGNGSLGNEINYFGKATREALGQFQLKNGIITKKMSKSYGVFGPSTRRFINNNQ